MLRWVYIKEVNTEEGLSTNENVPEQKEARNKNQQAWPEIFPFQITVSIQCVFRFPYHNATQGPSDASQPALPGIRSFRMVLETNLSGFVELRQPCSFL